MRALVVEKDHTVRDLVKVALQQFEGVAVDTAEDAWALELAKERPYDVVVVDDQLAGGTDGTELLRQIRDLGVRAPAILLTHGPPEAHGKEAGSLGIVSVLSVPLDTVDTFRAIVAARQRAGNASR